MAQRSSGDLAGSRDISDQLDAIRVGGLCGIELLISAFHSINNGGESDVACEAGFGIVMDGADRGADLIVRVGGDVFHKEVDPTRISLQDLKYLQGAITDVDLGRFGSFHRLGVAEMRRDIFGQYAREKDGKKAAKSG